MDPTMRCSELWSCLLLLRVIVVVFSVLALVFIAVDKQEGFFPLQVFGLPQPILVKTTAEYKLITGLKFYMGAMGTIAGYSLLLIALGFVSSGFARKSKNWWIFLGDMAIAYLNVSASSVGTEIAYLAERGAPDVMWNKLCNSFRHYCLIYGVSLVSSFVCSLAAFAVAGISAYHLFRLYGTGAAPPPKLQYDSTVPDGC